MSDTAKQNNVTNVSHKKQRNRSQKMIIEMSSVRLSNFMYIFNLRQGAVFIALQQISISSFLLIILLVAITHLGDMLSMLHDDMEDDAERHGFYDYDERLTLLEREILRNNNQRQFAKAQHLASVTVKLLYTSTILTAIYMACCVSLLHGALKYKRECVLLWIVAAWVAAALLFGAIVIGDGYTWVVKTLGGHRVYYLISALFVLAYIYAICAVTSFALEMGTARKRVARSTEKQNERDENNELGERMLLIDQAAHSTLLSSAQLYKMASGTRTQFV